ncbi:hypothetical protein LCGC14_0262740 [marine sediment metagenome]|uniref:Uncharacterized protein n=1 Tax=marine sediment metagenome TaxID=412755 RepID=A0A0F9U191_9ZZZZ
MKLWLFKGKEDLPEDDNPWQPGWDEDHGFVVRAEDEEIATTYIRQESAYYGWKYEKYYTVEELLPAGDPGIIV